MLTFHFDILEPEFGGFLRADQHVEVGINSLPPVVRPGDIHSGESLHSDDQVKRLDITVLGVDHIGITAKTHLSHLLLLLCAGGSACGTHFKMK